MELDPEQLGLGSGLVFSAHVLPSEAVMVDGIPRMILLPFLMLFINELML